MADDQEKRRQQRPTVASRSNEDRWKTRARLKVLAVALILLASVGAIVWFLNVRYGSTPVTPIETQPTLEPISNANAPSIATPEATPTAATVETPAPTASLEPTPPQQDSSAVPGVQENGASLPPVSSSQTQPLLLVPVQGVRAEDLRDTYTEARSEGRTHNAIDIIAPRGTPVLAAADGPIVKLFQSVPGGITIYQLATDNKTILYYAHLERYADGLAEGRFARRGEVIGYVGDTGNAGAGNYHLHFSVSITDDPKRWWAGTNVNPYPLLKN